MAPNTKSPSPKRNPIRLLVRSLSRDLFGVYRPEQHYMRGPGPKSREKHAPLPRPENLDLRTTKAAMY